MQWALTAAHSTYSTTVPRPAFAWQSGDRNALTAIVTQNGNAYEEGLSDGWNPIRAYWREPTQANRDALRILVQPESHFALETHAGQIAAAIRGFLTDSQL